MLTQHLSQDGDLNAQTGFTDKDRRPNSAKNLLFADHCPPSIEKHHQKIECAATEFDQSSMHAQFASTREHYKSTSLNSATC
jgi:hypothetical protein